MFHKGKIFLLNKYQSVMDWERQTSYEITYMWNPKKKTTNELFYKTETVTGGENKLMGGRRGRDKLQDWD